MVLGRVCKLQPQEGCRDFPHGPIVGTSLFIPGGQTPELLEAVDHPLHQVALLVELGIKSSLSALITLAGNGDPNPMAAGILADGPAAVAFVAYNALRPQPGSALSPFDRPLRHQ